MISSLPMDSFPHSPLKLVITDIDGTLLDDDGNLPDINRRALEHCKNRGVKTCLATGRRWTTCSKLLDRLELYPLIDYCILNNGMLVREISKQQILYQREFPLQSVLEIVMRFQTLGLDPIVLGHNQDGKTKDVFHRKDCLMNGDFIAKNPEHALKISDWQELASAHLVELVLIGKKADLQAAAAVLAGLPVEIVLLRNSFYKEYMLEVTPLGVSKWLGVQQLFSHLKITSPQTMAVGDSDNDYELLKNTHFSFAVSNAEKKVKDIVNHHTGENNHGGFGQAVFKLLQE